MYNCVLDYIPTY